MIFPTSGSFFPVLKLTPPPRAFFSVPHPPVSVCSGVLLLFLTYIHMYIPPSKKTLGPFFSHVTPPPSPLYLLLRVVLCVFVFLYLPPPSFVSDAFYCGTTGQVKRESRCRLLAELCLFSAALVSVGFLAGLS